MNKNSDITSSGVKDQNEFRKIIREKKRELSSLPNANPINKLRRINVFKGLKKYSIKSLMEEDNNEEKK